MKKVKAYFTFVFLFVATCSFAKGHGGGHGHGGHGHSGGNHSSGHSSSSSHSSSRSTQSSSANNKTTNHTTTNRTTSGSRTTAGTPVGVTNVSGYRNNVRVNQVNGVRSIGTAPAYSGGGYGYYPREYPPSYPYYYYGYAPFYNYPYFGMWSFGMGITYSPSYSTAPPPSNNYGPQSNEPLDGYVVFEHDTLSGDITIRPNSISLVTADSVRGYDYVFKIKKPGLTCVTAYNEDDKQLNLVRLQSDPKKLWRVVHTGKLSLYDERHGFIYRPEDVDVKSLTVVYEGHEESLNSSSANETKNWLTDYVNKAYGLNLNAKDYNWNSLLIYIDRLD